ncbi:hypothetical protein [Nocardioides sp. URHA0032]|uniref:hypothetical protein n=1 Tax=Nocardioides sp. URHA0032 TaxID=1380388 RepID=UPI00048FE495|nr:hypothetical protein [Nocardioides sp. URHA0032]
MTWQPTAVLYPDAELTTIAALRTLINAQSGQSDVKVVRTIPATRPARCVQVVRDGGNSANLRDKARLRVNVWDTTDQKATDLARLVVALVPRLVGANGVLRTEHLSGPYEIPDAAPMRYLLFQIDLRGEALS